MRREFVPCSPKRLWLQVAWSIDENLRSWLKFIRDGMKSPGPNANPSQDIRMLTVSWTSNPREVKFTIPGLFGRGEKRGFDLLGTLEPIPEDGILDSCTNHYYSTVPPSNKACLAHSSSDVSSSSTLLSTNPRVTRSASKLAAAVVKTPTTEKKK